MSLNITRLAPVRASIQNTVRNSNRIATASQNVLGSSCMGFD